MPRAFGIGSLIIGMIAVIVIGIYLRFNMTDEYFWVGSMWLLGLGFILQLGTLSMFFVDLCEDGVECSFGPGAWATSPSNSSCLHTKGMIHLPIFLVLKNYLSDEA